MEKALVIMPGWIGDCALALSVIHRKVTMQDAAITLLVQPHLIPLVSLLADHEIIPFNRKSFSEYRDTLKAVRSNKFDAVYVLPHSFSSALFAFATGIKKRVGVSREQRQFLFTHALPRSVRTNTQHITYEYALVIETDYVPPDYWQGKPLEKSQKYKDAIVFCPGSRFGPAKRWDGYASLIPLLSGHTIIVLGDSGDTETAELLHATAPDRIVNLAGKTSLVEACRIIAGAAVVVANDSGLMHVAGYLGTPVVGIFGSTSPTWTRPLGAKVKIASVKTGCPPCFKRTCRRNDYICLSSVAPESVAELVNTLISSRHSHL